MQISKKILNLRCTVFIDKIVPFSIKTVAVFKDTLQIPLATPIILQDIQNVFIPNQPNQNWGINENEINIVEVHGNKIDIFNFDETLKESAFCKSFAERISPLLKELNARPRRLAFAPTYTIENADIVSFYEKNLTAPNFRDAGMQEFSMNRVYYKNEDFKGVSFNMIYNINAVVQQNNMLGFNKEKNLIIMNDINTRDLGNRFYVENEVDIFYNNISERNEEFLKLFLGE